MSARASFSPEEIADMHGVAASTIRKKVQAGVVAKVPNLGRTVRIAIDEVEAKFGPIPEHVLRWFEENAA